MTRVTLDTVGRQVTSIPVELSTRFLEHFSEQLYSSPQKAFEELISNGWDAGATLVDVRIDANLQAPTATLAVFDNGTSMDLDCAVAGKTADINRPALAAGQSTSGGPHRNSDTVA